MDGIFVPGVAAPESPERCPFRQEAPFRAPFCPFYNTCKPRCPIVPMEVGEWVNQVQGKRLYDNATRIRAMDDEKMAKFLSSLPCCPPGADVFEKCYPKGNPTPETCYKCWLTWLRQTAKEDTDT